MDDKIQNTLNNLSGKQKIGFVVGVVLFASILIVVLAVFLTGASDFSNPEKISDGTYKDEQGNTVTVETSVNENGEKVTTKTKEDKYGNVTTVDPDLITTYFPYQKMREHVDWSPTLRYYVNISEEDDSVINALIEGCDEENDKTLVYEYINSIPLDMSGYTINFETFETDADCGE